MTNDMNTPTNPPAKPPRPKREQPDPNSREARLAEALRANLRRRKAAAKAAPKDQPENDSGAAQSASEKPADLS
jgi:hypothetical protein